MERVVGAEEKDDDGLTMELVVGSAEGDASISNVIREWWDTRGHGRGESGDDTHS